MAKMYAGVDVGYGQVKVVFGDALNSRSKVLFPYAIKRGEIGRIIFPELLPNVIEITNKYWLCIDGVDVQIGENAGSIKSRIEKSISKRDYVDYRIMALGSIAMLLQEKGLNFIDLCLTVGTPKTVVDEMKNNLISVLSGEHNFKVCWFGEKAKKDCSNIHINVNKVDIFEQGVGAFVSLSMLFDENGNIKGLDRNAVNGSIAVLDIGTYTTNFVLFSNGRYESRKSESGFDFGTANVIDTLREEIFKMYGISFPPHIINKSIVMNDSSKIIIGSENIDVTELKEKLLDLSWQDLSKYIKDSIEVAKLEAYQSKNPGLKVVFTGGGAKLFADRLKKEFNGDMFVYSRDPVFDNALGFFIVGYFANKG